MNCKTLSIFVAALLFIAVSALLPSCGKEGPQGIPGPQGEQGAAGPAGADGSVIYSGTGVPAVSIGQDGDYYLDRSTGNLYGPKTATGWGTPIPLGGSGSTGAGAQGPAGSQGPQGPQGPAGATGGNGATGTAGSAIYSGNGAPAAALGNIGDYYLDKTNYELYGPKTANGWGTPTLLRGAQGPQGPAGPAGVAGSVIYSGAGAPATALGAIGDYYLDKSNVNFYGPKTANGWGTPISLNGGTGAQGPAGPQGPQGPAGVGGATGATGAAGSQIYSGTTAPPAATGKAGDYYIDDMHAVLYGPKTATGWPATGLSLQVNNTITYNFVNKVQHNLPYNWVAAPIGLAAGFPTSNYIDLPYNSATAQTVGFTIPQAIVDNGLVLSYIRYFNGPANDTATDAGMTSWTPLPISMLYRYIDPGSGDPVTVPVNIDANFDDNGFYIDLEPQVYSTGNVYASQNVPAEIRIVLIPASETNTIDRISSIPVVGK